LTRKSSTTGAEKEEALAKRVIRLMRKEWDGKEEAEKEEASKKEATKDMVARWSDWGQGCFKDVRI
jgi:hypothetical protein